MWWTVGTIAQLHRLHSNKGFCCLKHVTRQSTDRALSRADLGKKLPESVEKSSILILLEKLRPEGQL